MLSCARYCNAGQYEQHYGTKAKGAKLIAAAEKVLAAVAS
ncbi:hypothetical protein SynBIOSE41_01335 [Synechococcus sp. BIOS-E4-1]|nr:hypothetical protein SynBIOSE41_01335 [Synechococcus sp. BIOS-E4-1]